MLNSHSFQYRGGRASLNVLRGKVVAHKQWVTSDVQGSGGGGYVSNGGGHISNVRISTTHTNHISFFVRSNDGQEASVSLGDIQLDLRDDHEVSLVWIVRDGDASGPYLFVVNHSLRVINRLERGFIQLNSLNWPDRRSNWPAGVAVLAGIALLFVRWYLGVAVLAGVVLWLLPSVNADERKLSAQVDRLLKALGTDGYVTHAPNVSWREHLQVG